MATINVGDTVTVPGDMHGVVKFIGPVAGKKGTFAGVQLAPEYAPRGKNSGEVDGKHYFRTTIPGSGIFLPLEKAVKRSGLGVRASPGPGTPTRLSSFNQGGRTPGMVKPNFSQSIGPGVRTGAASPALKPPVRRESLPRPASPLRKVNTPTPKSLGTPKTRPSGIGFAKSTTAGPGHYKPGQRPTTNFSRSLRQSSSTPNQTGASPSLGPESSFDEAREQEAESTPTPTPHASRSADVHVEKYEVKIRELNEELSEARRQLREQSGNIAEMDRNFNELQKLLPALEEDQAGKRGRADDEEDLPRDVASLRDIVREKNEKIKLLTAEFDAHRADFRSTIDTLEMASTETERVYEKRVDELLDEIRTLQDRSEDVESVAQQLKQLEELVQELEEGLEDARRGEAEARSEVEFLRGEVERSRSELRRERERLRTEEQLNGYSPGNLQDLETQLSAKDDEIRGLKVIIQSLNESQHKDDSKRNGTTSNANGNGTGNGHPLNEKTTFPPEDDNRFSLQQQIRDLEALLQQKSAHEEELANEVKQLRNSVTLSKFPLPGSAFGIHTGIRSAGHSRGNSEELDRKHLSSGTTGSQRTVVVGPASSKSKGGIHARKQSQQTQDWHDASTSPVKHHQYIDRDGDAAGSDDGVTDVSSSSANAGLWCEICEEGGHDILSCSNMFGPAREGQSQGHGPGHGSLGSRSGKDAVREGLKRSGDYDRGRVGPGLGGLEEPDRPAPLMSRKNTSNSAASTPSNPPPTSELPSPPVHDDTSPSPSASRPKSDATAPPRVAPALIEGTGAQAGMLAGRTTGVIDPEKWCALCERDGHDSVDCPLEDAF
ncbi:hypothetical protein A1O3_07379 [Capronia epimyces CBS 606.96]|uniref:CAP-Gly domain-containing protein n=1 Tax=Capronia epimyces CBS 606.96 TaxID=1182542 RepID=W9XVR0_9EURO|nr:uncharacterized protein A1O3_07379 [Capronia epimyces CBS 606.96]EXJ81091.1 hypothetical protein A1O3_07379 [Capronia epimyces CBS 606.96]